MPAAYKWTPEQLQDILSSYECGETALSIARRYGVSHPIINPLLKKHGTMPRSMSEASRRCTCDYAYFHTIDTEEKAYWLGFFTADGCITTGNRITVNLGIADCAHLYKLRDALQSTHKVSTSNRSCAFVIRSSEMAASLATHGILPNKTFSTNAAQVTSELAKHYWRGVIDGDGTFAKDGSSLALAGDYDVVLAFQTFVLSHCPEVKATVRKSENIYAFCIRRQATKCMLQLLYKGATIYLDRKYQRAQQILTRSF
jgi:hypothetical protein